MPIIKLIYNISQFCTPRQNAEDLSYPIIYHTVVYTLYYNSARSFNHTIIWYLWQHIHVHSHQNGFYEKQNDVTCELYPSWPKYLNMVKIGLKLMKQSKCAYSEVFSVQQHLCNLINIPVPVSVQVEIIWFQSCLGKYFMGTVCIPGTVEM